MPDDDGFIPQGFDILIPPMGIPSRDSKPKKADLSGITPWSDIARQLDPMMAKDEYDALREKYFYDNIAPRLVQANLGVESTFEQFKKQTDRAPLITGADRFMLPVIRGGLAALKEIAQPFATLENDLNKGKPDSATAEVGRINQAAPVLDMILKREGLPSASAEIAGSLVGMGVPLAVLGSVAGPMAEGVAGRMITSARGAAIAEKALRGGLLFGSFEYLREEEEDQRVISGLKGAAFGVVLEGGLATVFGKFGKNKAVEEAVDNINKGKPPSTPLEAAVDETLAREVIDASDIAGAQGREVYATVHMGTIDQASVIMNTKQAGKKMQRTISLKTEEGRQSVLNLMEKGWTPQDVRVSEDTIHYWQEFKAANEDLFNENYFETVLETGQSDPGKVASVMNNRGYEAVPSGKNRVRVRSAVSGAKWKKKPPAKIIREEIERANAENEWGLSEEAIAQLEWEVDHSWSAQGGPRWEESMSIVNRTVPNLGPPKIAVGKTVGVVPKKGVLKTEALAEGFFEERIGLGQAARARELARARVDLVDGVWSENLQRNLSREDIESAISTLWNENINLPSRASARRLLEEVLPEALPERFPNVNEQLKKALWIPEELKVKPAAEEAVSITDKDVALLGELTGERREELIKSLEQQHEVSVPPGELTDIEQVMAEEIGRGISGPEARRRGVKRAPRGDVPDDTEFNFMGRERTPKAPAGWGEGIGKPADVDSFTGGWLTKEGNLREAWREHPAQGEWPAYSGPSTHWDAFDAGLEKVGVESTGYDALMGPSKIAKNMAKNEGLVRVGLNKQGAMYIQTFGKITPLQMSKLFQLIKSHAPRSIAWETPKASGFGWTDFIRAMGEDIQRMAIGKPKEFTLRRPGGDLMTLPLIQERPLYYTTELPTTHPLWGGGSTEAAKLSSLGRYLTIYGAKAEQIPQKLWDKPLLLVPKGGWTKGNVFHEAMHAVTDKLGYEFDLQMPRRGTAVGIGIGLKQEVSHAYGRKGAADLIGEAFTHAATAVRVGDQLSLIKYARWDTSVEQVIKMVKETSDDLLNHALRQPDSVLRRRGERVFRDLKRRTNEEVFLEIERAHIGPGYTYYDEQAQQWIMRMARGDEAPQKVFKTTKELWDEFDRLAAMEETGPSYTFMAENAGLRGPFVPDGLAPKGRKPPLPNFALDPRKVKDSNLGWQAMRGWMRPFFPWVATLDQKINKVFEGAGYHFPINEMVRAVDDAHRASIKWVRTHMEDIYKMFKNTSEGKFKDYMEFLSYLDKDQPAMVNKLKMSHKDIQAAQEFWNWLDTYREQTGINGREWIRNFYPQLRRNGFNPDTVREWSGQTPGVKPGFWERMVREGDFDPEDNHLGRFANFLLDQGIQERYTGKPLKALDKLVNRQTPQGRYVLPGNIRGPLNNYVNYMKGYPDQTQQSMNTMMNAFQGFVSKRIRDINKFLPEGAKLREWETPPKQAINQLLLFSYAAGLAGRPAANFRDLLQGLVTGMTVLGPKRYFAEIGKLMTDYGANWDRATKGGAMLERTNIGDLWGDIFQEVPTAGKGAMARMTRIANTMLLPQRWTDNFNRATIFNAEKDLATKGLRLYRKGLIDERQFAEEYSTLWWNDAPNITRMLEYAQKEFVPDITNMPRMTGSALEGQRRKLMSDIDTLTVTIKEPKLPKSVRARYEQELGRMERELDDVTRKLETAEPESVPKMKFKDIEAKSEEDYIDQVSTKIANELVDLTMWPYRKGAQPSVLRTGLGRVFGQYGMYPMNYLDFTRRMVSKMGDPNLRGRALKTMGLWAAVNYGAVSAMEGLGAETGHWWWVSPGAYSGGPNMQFVQDLMLSMEASDEGRAARSRVLRHPINFIPGSAAMRNIIMSFSQDKPKEGLLSPEVIRVLGFRPLEVKDEDLEEWLTKELGLAPAYRRR